MCIDFNGSMAASIATGTGMSTSGKADIAGAIGELEDRMGVHEWMMGLIWLTFH